MWDIDTLVNALNRPAPKPSQATLADVERFLGANQ